MTGRDPGVGPGDNVARLTQRRVQRGCQGDDLVSVTSASCAIAESGSVVMLSGPQSPTSLNFLPDVHFVIVEANQLVAHIEDAWTKLRQLDNLPRTVK